MQPARNIDWKPTVLQMHLMPATAAILGRHPFSRLLSLGCESSPPHVNARRAKHEIRVRRRATASEIPHFLSLSHATAHSQPAAKRHAAGSDEPSTSVFLA
jgi:hypothetical protein